MTAVGTLQQARHLVQQHLNAGNDDAASVLCANIRRSMPNDPFATFAQAKIAWRRGLHDVALRLFQEVAGMVDLPPADKFTIGSCLQERGRWHESAPYFEAVLPEPGLATEAASRLTHINANLGVCYLKINEMALASPHFRRAAECALGSNLPPAICKAIAQGPWAWASEDGSLKERWQHVARTLAARGGACLAGPFQGMLLWDDASLLQPSYLIGSYERELADIIEATASSTSYDAVIDVGTYRGYYAVGLARRMTRATVYGFEIDDGSRALCTRLAELNGVADRVVLGGACDPVGLRAAIQRTERPFVLMDCEGFEKVLVDLEAVPELARADLLIETHDVVEPGVTDLMVARLAQTHETEVIEPEPGNPNHHPLLDGFDAADRWLAVAEGRPEGVRWVWARSRLHQV